MKKLLTALFHITGSGAFAQDQKELAAITDTTPKHTYMAEITIVGRGSKSDYQQMPEVVGTNIYAGKKNGRYRGAGQRSI